MLKRLFDVLLAFILLLVFSPVMLVVSVLIVVLEGWPVFFVQQRIGQFGKPFGIYKFRTMTVSKAALKGTFDAGDASRVTNIGKLLRKTKLDEVPQLLNVLGGSMSLVGPRPEVGKWVQEYPQRWAVVHTVKPGITDNASLEFRNEEEILAASTDKEGTYRNQILPRKLDLYEQYVLNQSFWSDLGILFRTGISVLFK
jgi:lipopolysaccharide/colanic/teichoic acid biosynthesis glycosyltransferase